MWRYIDPRAHILSTLNAFAYSLPFIADSPCIGEIHLQSLTDTTITFSWATPAPGLSYNILLCQGNTSRCLQFTCTDCNSYGATGLSPSTNYTVTVDSFSPLSSGECISQGCTSNTATAQTGMYTWGNVHMALHIALNHCLHSLYRQCTLSLAEQARVSETTCLYTSLQYVISEKWICK